MLPSELVLQHKAAAHAKNPSGKDLFELCPSQMSRRQTIGEEAEIVVYRLYYYANILLVTVLIGIPAFQARHDSLSTLVIFCLVYLVSLYLSGCLQVLLRPKVLLTINAKGLTFQNGLQINWPEVIEFRMVGAGRHTPPGFLVYYLDASGSLQSEDFSKVHYRPKFDDMIEFLRKYYLYHDVQYFVYQPTEGFPPRPRY
jgi:hypothetical protein